MGSLIWLFWALWSTILYIVGQVKEDHIYQIQIQLKTEDLTNKLVKYVTVYGKTQPKSFFSDVNVYVFY
jgi:hypothetical protein